MEHVATTTWTFEKLEFRSRFTFAHVRVSIDPTDESVGVMHVRFEIPVVLTSLNLEAVREQTLAACRQSLQLGSLPLPLDIRPSSVPEPGSS